MSLIRDVRAKGIKTELPGNKPGKEFYMQRVDRQRNGGRNSFAEWIVGEKNILHGASAERCHGALAKFDWGAVTGVNATSIAGYPWSFRFPRPLGPQFLGAARAINGVNRSSPAERFYRFTCIIEYSLSRLSADNLCPARLDVNIEAAFIVVFLLASLVIAASFRGGV